MRMYQKQLNLSFSPVGKGLMAGFLLLLICSFRVQADTIFIGVFEGNDRIRSDGSAEIVDLAGLSNELSQVGKLDWGGGVQQSSGDLTVTATAFKHGGREAVAGEWRYGGTEQIDYIAVKFGPQLALYQVTHGESSGVWDIAALCDDADTVQFCNKKGKPKSLSHLSAYTSISAVPIPPAIWLFGSGLVGLGAVARRRQSV